MKLAGWGRFPVIQATARSFETKRQLVSVLESFSDCIVYAQGNSYGDSALSSRVVVSSRYNKLLSFDPNQGIVTCESGVTLSELAQVFLPRGWFLGVTPGTKHVTVGGAIASDVHGKNHHLKGCFSSTVVEFDLMLPDGEIRHCSPCVNRPLFLATCGGMGLTGVILTASIQLIPVRSRFIGETTIRCGHLEEVFEQFEANRSASYSVAWIDCLAARKNLGRSVLFLGEHSEDDSSPVPESKNLSIPFDFPSWWLNRGTVGCFNSLYYTRASNKNFSWKSIDQFFYPLDKILHWNRMYGTGGFTQYQLVLPKEASLPGLVEILKRISKANPGAFLGVLKLFGKENDNLLSFPLEGYTLAVDFKINRDLFPFLDELDQIVLDFGGRLYLSKDVRMNQVTFRRGYPRWENFANLRERHSMRKFKSLQSERIGL